jgi:hypothetical protein
LRRRQQFATRYYESLSRCALIVAVTATVASQSGHTDGIDESFESADAALT